MRFGVEKNLLDKIFKIALFTDGTLHFIKAKNESRPIDSSGSGIIITELSTSSNTPGFELGLGLRFQPFKHFSIGLETSGRLALFFEHDLFGQFSKIRPELYYFPIRTIALSYHF